MNGGRELFCIFSIILPYIFHEVAIVTETSCTYNMYILFYVCAYMKISGRLKMDVRTLTSVTVVVVDNTLHKAIAGKRSL